MGEPTTGDALIYLDSDGVWAPLEDSGSETPQGLPFILQAACQASEIQPIGPLTARKHLLDHVVLEWPADQNASSYNTWHISDDVTGVPSAREGGPWPPVTGCHQASGTSCTHSNSVVGPGGQIFLYQVRGVCDTEEAPE
jgi:hypothetical protein